MHPRQALAQQEAEAWQQAHLTTGLRSADGKRLPAEVSGLRTRGRALTEQGRDGRDEVVRYRYASTGTERSVRTRRTRSGGVVRTVSPVARKAVRATQTTSSTPALPHREHEGQTPEQVHHETQIYAVQARRLALSELQAHGELRPVTVVLGQRVPQALLRPVASKPSRVVRASALDRVTEDAYTGEQRVSRYQPTDRRPLQQLAAQELRELLLLALTQREVEALDERAHGVAVHRRDTLQRAQRKARAALAELRAL